MYSIDVYIFLLKIEYIILFLTVLLIYMKQEKHRLLVLPFASSARYPPSMTQYSLRIFNYCNAEMFVVY